MPTNWVGILVAFLVCGAASRFIWDPDTWREWLGFPLPFGLLAGWLIARNRLPVYVILCVAVWNAAYRTTRALSGDADFLAFSLGGLIGGLGLAFSAAVTNQAFTPRNVLIVGAVGLGASWSFLLPESWNLNLAVPFAIWQGAVGTALWKLRRS